MACRCLVMFLFFSCLFSFACFSFFLSFFLLFFFHLHGGIPSQGQAKELVLTAGAADCA